MISIINYYFRVRKHCQNERLTFGAENNHEMYPVLFCFSVAKNNSIVFTGNYTKKYRLVFMYMNQVSLGLWSLDSLIRETFSQKWEDWLVTKWKITGLVT